MLTDALGRVAVHDGLAGVTIRHVAAEAGVSVGLVQHYFASKEDLLLAALFDVAARVRNRLDRAIDSLGPAATERDRLRATLLEFVPLDAEGRTIATLFRAFDAGGVNDPQTTRAEAAAVPRGFDVLMRHRLEAAREAGELEPDVVISQEALTYMMLVLGLGDALLADALTPARAIEIIDYILERSFIR